MNRLLDYLKHVEELRQMDERKTEEPGNPSTHLEIGQKKGPMRKKTKNKINTWVTSITVAVLIFSAVGKIAGVEEIAEKLNKVGVGKFIILLGVVELLLALLFISPKTMKLSFILLSCYFSGALATEISHGSNFLAPSFFLALVWIASFIRDKSIFTLRERHSRISSENPWNTNWMPVK